MSEAKEGTPSEAAMLLYERDVARADRRVAVEQQARLQNLLDLAQQAIDAEQARATAASQRAAELEGALGELHTRAEAFWAFLQGEHGVKLSAADCDDHNVWKYFAALDRARALTPKS